jgi:beta-barrel assembly-enhancing protease
MTKHPSSSKFLALTITLALLVTQAVAVTGGPQLPNPGKAPLTREQQIELGNKAAAQVYQQMPVLPDNSSETQYIRQLGAKLVAVIPPEYSWPYEFHVIPQKEINAFALPGGQIFINVGTIAAAQNEAQLAGVMAHEMSHVYMQHSAKQAGKAQTTAAIFGLAGAILGAATGGALGSLAQAGINFGAAGIILKYSREDEAQADSVGAIIMWKAGYDPRAMADFFQLLASQGGSPPQLLSDHPNPGNREQAIKQEIAGWPPKTYLTSSPAFEQARKEAQNLKVYTAQQIADGAKTGMWARLNRQNGALFRVNGAVVPTSADASPAGPVQLSSVQPNLHMVKSNLGLLTISRPDNWELMAPQQRGQSVQIAPPAGVSGNNVGYGVVINAVQPDSGQSLEQATNDLVSAMQTASDLKPFGSSQSIKVAGIEGRSQMLQSTSPFPDANGRPQIERDWLVTVPRSDGSIVWFVFVAPEAQFDHFRPTFDSMLKSVRLQ